MTAPAEPARATDVIQAWLITQHAAAHVRVELLRRQQARQALAPTYQILETAREIQDTAAVERWLGQQLRTGGHQ